MVADSNTPTPRGWEHSASPFHEGEAQVQSQLGIREKMEGIGRKVIRGFMPDQHRAFYERLPWIFVGATDETGQPWASVLAGSSGFVTSSDAKTLTVGAVPGGNDPLAGLLREGSPVGLLGLELPTRRRNRVNGTINKATPDGIEINVTQSFGNCPKYIQAREQLPNAPVASTSGSPVFFHTLSPQDKTLIATADTFFIASHSGDLSGPSSGVDVSHRGGKPGFIRTDTDRTLTIPDFVGNSLYNTIGNLLIDPRAGLLIPDFQSGDLLYLAVDTDIVWDGREVDDFAEAQRLLRFSVTKGIRLNGALPLRWSGPEPSTFLKGTGEW